MARGQGGSIGVALKRILLGRPMSSGELEHTLLPKTIALPVFSSDPLSSNAYATQEALIVLAMAGTAALHLIVPISLAVAALLAIVVTSYRQTVRAYPSGGGAYRVARENLGLHAGLTAASALLIDYVLTVAVSMTAGVDAVVSAAPGLAEHKQELATGFIVLVSLANLRGARESGLLFAIPTYGFVASIYTMLIAGLLGCLDGCPRAETAGTDLPVEHGLTLFLLLKAFAAGTTALTGVEAIADGVQAFRYPQSRNAATTLGIMGALSISMFLGISWLARHTGVVYLEEEHTRTVVAQIAHAVFGGGFMFYVVQVMSAMILILAANTAYQDFPRLSSILARDHIMPRQFLNRGDRLVFSNGIVILAVTATALVWLFDASLTRLIQLYLVGVFVSFTLSQTGMVLRAHRLRYAGWRRTVAISGTGAVVTGLVLCIVVATKFAGGAWLVVTATPVLILTMRAIHRHYEDLRAQLAHPERRPPDARPGHQNVVIYVHRLDAAAARAVGYVRSIRPAAMSAITFDGSIAAAWSRLAPDVPLIVLEQRGSKIQALRSHLRTLRRGLETQEFLTVVVPEVLRSRSFFEIVRRPGLHRLKGALLFERGVQVIDIPVLKEQIDTSVDPSVEPARHYALVLVSGVHNATLQAIEYAETLRPFDLHAVMIGLDPDDTERVGNDWLEAEIDLPLEIEDSPFRDIGRTLTDYLRRYRADGTERVVTVVLPEFVVSKKRHQLLHGQTALLVKRHLLFEPGIVVASVPYHLTKPERPAGSPAARQAPGLA